jgi:KEOPS complex subunit Cgi121
MAWSRKGAFRQDRKLLNFLIRSSTMNEIRLLFGRAVLRDKDQLISAIQDLQSRYGCVIQALDADRVVSERHLAFAIEKALAAFREGRNIAKDPGLEIMRYASGERQIERALLMGLSPSTKRLALILASFGRDCRWPSASEISRLVEPDGSGCSFDNWAVREAFHISSQEMEAAGEDKIEELVLERVALVDTYH